MGSGSGSGEGGLVDQVVWVPSSLTWLRGWSEDCWADWIGEKRVSGVTSDPLGDWATRDPGMIYGMYMARWARTHAIYIYPIYHPPPSAALDHSPGRANTTSISSPFQPYPHPPLSSSAPHFVLIIRPIAAANCDHPAPRTQILSLLYLVGPWI